MTSSTYQTPDDEQMKIEASRQIGRDVEIRKVHISLVGACDTVFHEGKARTVCAKDLRRDGFMGLTLFGDSYILGRKPVARIIMNPLGQPA